MRETDGILFDLDGTLWDAVEGICRGWNQGFQECGLPPVLTVPQLRACMGLRMEEIAARILPQIGDGGARMAVMEVCYRHQLDELAAHGGTLYPGVPETLRALSQRFPLCIVSNCQDGYIQCFLKVHGLEDCIRDFECPGRTGCGKAETIRLVAGRNGLKCPVYVGDTQGDADAARAAGVPFFHAAYGFGAVEAAEARLNGIGELTGLLTPP